MERKLAAIMVADFVGSTSAMETDEEGTVSLVSSCLDAIDISVKRHSGRIFSTAGDAVLAEFSSPVNALRAAMEGRSAIAAIPGASTQHMRFGLHVADVMVVGSDLRGDGVNFAARLQSSAEPGAIEVSETVYDNVRRVSPCSFEALGERTSQGHIGSCACLQGSAGRRSPPFPFGTHSSGAFDIHAAEFGGCCSIFEFIVGRRPTFSCRGSDR